MSRGLDDREKPIEEVEVAVAAVVARPAQGSGHVENGAVARAHRGCAGIEPRGVVLGEGVDPVRQAGELRTVGGKHKLHGKRADPRQGGEEIGEGPPIGVGLETDGRRDVREDVVAGEEEVIVPVEEDDMAAGVAGGGDDLQAPRAQLDRRPRLGVEVGRAPEAEVARDPTEASAAHHGLHLGGEGGRAPAAHLPAVRIPRLEGASLIEGGLQGAALPGAEEHRGPGLPTKAGRLAVVVAVHVGDEHALDVSQSGPDRSQAPLQRRPALLPLPAGVDEGDPLAVLQDVDVDGAEPVAGKRQRDPMHPGSYRVDARLGPRSRAGPLLGRERGDGDHGGSLPARGRGTGRPVPAPPSKGYAAAPVLSLDGSPLGIDDLVEVARRGSPVVLSEAGRQRMLPALELVQRFHAGGDPVYGVTTGFGALADRAIPDAERARLQRSVIRSHAAGMGEPLPAEVVRGMLLLRARSLAAGCSGVRPELPEAICGLLCAGITPWVPEHGSLGASGDLAPLAHAAAALTGEGWVRAADGGRRPAGAALAEAGLAPIIPGPKEGLALINGTEGMASALGLATFDLEHLLTAIDCACALSVEALLGSPRPYDAEVMALRPAPGQEAAAANLRALLEDSAVVASHRESHHAVQDAYSLRCAPQVHGAARDVVGFCRQTVEREMASVVDNPVVLAGRGELFSTGNFHGQALAYAADFLAAACADLAAISERRINRLLDPARSRGLPAFLSPDPGLNSGLMIAQYTAASCVIQLRQMAAPMAVHSLDTSAGQEDHVSAGFAAAMRTRRSVDLCHKVVAVEMVCAAQAVEMRAPLRPGAATAAILGSLRGRVPHLDDDRPLAPDLEAAQGWLSEGGWRDAAQAMTGPLR